MYGNTIVSDAVFSSRNAIGLHLFLAAWPEFSIWFTALGASTMAFNLNGFDNSPKGWNSSLNSSLAGKVKG
jgi:hypothetical protein